MRGQICEQMDSLLKDTLTKKKFDFGMQITEDELLWRPKDYIGAEVAEEVKFETSDTVQNRPDNLKILIEQDKAVTKELELHIDKPVNLEKMKGTIRMNQLKMLAKECAENWNMPTNIIAFLANSLSNETSGRVIPWKEFRVQLFREISK